MDRIYFFYLIITFSYCQNAKDVEKELVNKFEAQGDVPSRNQLIEKIGPFIDPPELKHRNYTEISEYLKYLNLQFPNLTYLYSAGESVRGRQLWVLTVSRFPKNHTQGIPEFKYIANMHGNEVSGRVFLVSLAWTLLNNYATNHWMRQLVDTTRIHLMPTMNPDGYEEALEGDDSGTRGRKNANGKDLNRNFPSRYPSFFPSNELQAETRAVMNWTRSIPFVLSASLHGGTTLVNYPFDDFPTRGNDHRYSPAPDNDLFVRLAYSYAKVHERMSKPGPRCLDDDLNIATDPQTGIVNGADWYIVSGGMQDWNYLNTNCFELTVELNCVKFPLQKDLRFLWNEHKYPLLHFVDQVHNAIHGTITDSSTGKGITNATISIDYRSKIVVSYENGEFWRLINLGTYEVTFDHPEYKPLTKTVLVSPNNRSPVLNIVLEQLRPPKSSLNRNLKPTNQEEKQKVKEDTDISRTSSHITISIFLVILLGIIYK